VVEVTTLVVGSRVMVVVRAKALPKAAVSLVEKPAVLNVTLRTKPRGR